MKSPYSWIDERARSGEPVSINTDRKDICRIIEYLTEIDGHGLTIQLDLKHGLMWVCKNDGEE